MKKTTIMAKIIKTDGTIVEVTPQNGTDFQLEELQKIVGGYIEILRLTDNEIMVANEEGKFYCTYNHKATQIAKEYEAIYKSDYICGDVLICNDDEVR